MPKIGGRGYQVFSASRSNTLPDEMSAITQISVDFSISGASSAFAQTFMDQYGVPDLLVNNAGLWCLLSNGQNFQNLRYTNQIEVLIFCSRTIVPNLCPGHAEEGQGSNS